MPDSYLLRSTACGSTLQDQTQCLPAHRFAATLRCEGNRRHRQALTFAGINVAVVKARKEHVMRDEKGRKVETAVEARAGFLDRPVLVVLCVSLALGVIVLGALWFGFFTPGA
jgi:hypothetical protein